MTLAVAAPGLLAVAALITSDATSASLRWGGGLLAAVAAGVAGLVLVHRVVFPLQTLANLLGGLREGDFSTRARGAMRDDALGEVFLEANALAETLREQRLGALEATALLRTVMAELDVAVFAFDGGQRLRLANRAAENLLRRPVEQLLGRTALELGLAEGLSGDPARTLPLTFPGAVGRFALRRSAFRQDGRAHQLLVLTDLSRALREEERQAWQRLVRVLGHELNNSLAPIKSLAGSLESLLSRDPLPADWREDCQRGLGVIGQRSDALTRFLDAYARLAKLPPPRCRPVDLPALIRRVAALDSRAPVVVRDGPPGEIVVDPDQMEQLLINLVRNAVDAILAPVSAHPLRSSEEPAVILTWLRRSDEIEVTVIDSGSGIASAANLFVPFFTTKPKGSGIGLILCRQIAESHGGSVTLENRTDRPGCVARLRLPLQGEGAGARAQSSTEPLGKPSSRPQTTASLVG
ncbi:MAG: PAS domain-containing sensor histidine kinase [Verrucomicrobia bacterium]|nr:PAS domain-containing sensor histidine kinase [Verrucomicrobiota bacterium]